jgi:serine/threonine protein phosphatase PrpC
MERFGFQIAAWSDAGGRAVNEDSFIVSRDLYGEEWRFVTNATSRFSPFGALLCVCDGMGGLKAGEAAATLTTDSIRSWFGSVRLLEEDATSQPELYIRKAVLAADRRLKSVSAADPSKAGMGCTIALAWLLQDKVYIGWCGDSRAYRYNPMTGLERLTHDHSYVQELVDTRRLRPELAHNHPESNIVTRSIGAHGVKPQPEVRVYDLHADDVLLLCTDGLSSVMRDADIEDVLRRSNHNMLACRDSLLAVSKYIGWRDNLTILLCRITYPSANVDVSSALTGREEQTIPSSDETAASASRETPAEGAVDGYETVIDSMEQKAESVYQDESYSPVPSTVQPQQNRRTETIPQNAPQTVAREHRTRRQNKRQKKLSLLAIISILLVSAALLFFVGYCLRNYIFNNGSVVKVAVVPKSGALGAMSWTLHSDGKLLITGKGEMPTVSGDYPWSSDADNIQSVIIGDGITSIASGSFSGFSILKSVAFPKSLTEISDGAFSNCVQLNDLTLPDSIDIIGAAAFGGCKALKSVSVPASVTMIGDAAFGNCQNLKQFTVADRNIAYSSDGGILYDKTRRSLVSYPNAKSDSCSIPTGVIKIGNYAFYGCSDLRAVTIAETVETIGDFAFCNCSSLTSVILPRSLTLIGDNAFGSNPSLITIHSLNPVPPASTSIIGDALNDCLLYVPQNSRKAYIQTWEWATENIREE